MSDSGRDTGPRCSHCNVPWAKHDGCTALCAKLETAKDAIKMLIEMNPEHRDDSRLLHAQKVLGL